MSEKTTAPILSGQFSKAMVYAELKHHNQVRKGGDVPYVGHLLSVTSLVINDGGSEDQGGPPIISGITAGSSRPIADAAWTAGWSTN
ncbi:hypothetical protein [Mycobacterium sp. 236(2023)]|uniref:hypothetical protein n=1 Tax=Mycobacterium sp. 236(2023) TaxID=3038163 RepID=UPI002415520D|nr:hypothetical protein [Mycobacterium sp. 236(2023)]MDG4663854.1 hypothetical protein [Mycobacterium sp. 236(2023)]